MTTVPSPAEDTAMRMWEFPEENPEPPARWGKYVPGEPQLRAAAFGTLVGLLVAVLMGAAYAAQPGASLWALNKTIFPTHSQDIAVRAVVSDLKNAQDILGNNKQPSPDQLTQARSSLNEAKQGLEFVSDSDERTSLQNLYLQLNQQLRQYTPEQAQQLPCAAGAPRSQYRHKSGRQHRARGTCVVTTAQLGYATAASAPAPAAESYLVPPPAGIPVDPVPDWPAPVAPPLTPNLLDLGVMTHRGPCCTDTTSWIGSTGGYPDSTGTDTTSWASTGGAMTAGGTTGGAMTAGVTTGMATTGRDTTATAAIATAAMSGGRSTTTTPRPGVV